MILQHLDGTPVNVATQESQNVIIAQLAAMSSGGGSQLFEATAGQTLFTITNFIMSASRAFSVFIDGSLDNTGFTPDYGAGTVTSTGGRSQGETIVIVN